MGFNLGCSTLDQLGVIPSLGQCWSPLTTCWGQVWVSRHWLSAVQLWKNLHMLKICCHRVDIFAKEGPDSDLCFYNRIVFNGLKYFNCKYMKNLDIRIIMRAKLMSV